MKQNLRFGLVLGRLTIVLKMSKIKLKYVFRAVFMGKKKSKKILSVHCSIPIKLINIEVRKMSILALTILFSVKIG